MEPGCCVLRRADGAGGRCWSVAFGVRVSLADGSRVGVLLSCRNDDGVSLRLDVGLRPSGLRLQQPHGQLLHEFRDSGRRQLRCECVGPARQARERVGVVPRQLEWEPQLPCGSGRRSIRGKRPIPGLPRRRLGRQLRWLPLRVPRLGPPCPYVLQSRIPRRLRPGHHLIRVRRSPAPNFPGSSAICSRHSATCANFRSFPRRDRPREDRLLDRRGQQQKAHQVCQPWLVTPSNFAAAE